MAQRALADAGGVGIEVDQLDLGDLASVHAFTERFLIRHPTLDILIASAGVMACPETRVGPGWEAQFAINHLGHYALANLLWPALAAAGTARVVAVASGRDPAWRIRWDDVQFERGYDKWEAYTQSKLANVLFARHLDLLGRPRGVRAFSVNPGWIRTPCNDTSRSRRWSPPAGSTRTGPRRRACSRPSSRARPPRCGPPRHPTSTRTAATTAWTAAAPRQPHRQQHGGPPLGGVRRPDRPRPHQLNPRPAGRRACPTGVPG
ncbi:SDR family NAD(P)-dependent oxidoreductase [Micromonospora sp. M12]